MLGGLFVEVACADVGYAAYLAVLAPGDQAELGVYLVVLKAVEHRAARVLKALGPVDVVELVKAGAQLDYRCHVLAVLGGLAEVVHELCLAGQAVDGYLDGYDRRVVRGLAQQPEKG